MEPQIDKNNAMKAKSSTLFVTYPIVDHFIRKTVVVSFQSLVVVPLSGFALVGEQLHLVAQKGNIVVPTIDIPLNTRLGIT